MIDRKDVEDFFKTLIMGDFVEDQNTAAMVIGGLIAMIPVLEQVMVTRDISGALFNINKRGGFKNAEPAQLVNLGFAAFGAVPEVGEAFKTVFKPLWKERAAARGAVHSGLDAIESLLGMRKGGAIAWVREELLGKWGSWVKTIIDTTDKSLLACIALTEFVATADGWEGWLIPSSVQALAKEMLEPLKKFQGQLHEPLTRAANEIQEFLTELLGEQVAKAVVATTLATTTVVVAQRARSGRNAAAEHPTGSPPPKRQRKVGKQDQAGGSPGGGPVSTTTQKIKNGFSDLVAREKGLIGEHIVDYLELKRLGGSWPHDTPSGKWQPETVQKLNADRRPVNLSLSDLPRINSPGIDAVWDCAGKPVTIVEAKASVSIVAAKGYGFYKEKKGRIPEVEIKRLSADHRLLHSLLLDYSDKGGGGGGMMQMSRAWVHSRIQGENISALKKAEVLANKYVRRTVLVTADTGGGEHHAEAFAAIQMQKTAVPSHEAHQAMREWDDADMDAVESARQEGTRRVPDQAAKRDENTTEKPQKNFKKKDRK